MRLPYLHCRLEGVQPIAGFAVRAIGPHEEGFGICNGFYDSSDPVFHKITPQLWGIYAGQALGSAARPEVPSEWLFVVHNDLTADLYLGNIPRTFTICAKRFLPAHCDIYRSDLIDISSVRVLDIPILETDSVAFCFR